MSSYENVKVKEKTRNLSSYFQKFRKTKEEKMYKIKGIKKSIKKVRNENRYRKL